MSDIIQVKIPSSRIIVHMPALKKAAVLVERDLTDADTRETTDGFTREIWESGYEYVEQAEPLKIPNGIIAVHLEG